MLTGGVSDINTNAVEQRAAQEDESQWPCTRREKYKFRD